MIFLIYLFILDNTTVLVDLNDVIEDTTIYTIHIILESKV